jgi:hypothetical protein
MSQLVVATVGASILKMGDVPDSVIVEVVRDLGKVSKDPKKVIIVSMPEKPRLLIEGEDWFMDDEEDY